MQEVAELDTMIVPVVRCVRNELGLPFDDAFYLQLIRAGHEQRAKFFEGFLQESLGTPNAERPDEP